MQSIYLLTSLQNFKTMIKKDDDDNDNFINRLIAAATNEVENFTKRKLRGRTYGDDGIPADYYNGSGGNKIYTKQYPIISVSELYDDIDRDWGSADLKASTDFIVWKDDGIIELYNDADKGSIFSKDIGNIKLIYTAGYDEFQVIEDTNDRIDFEESDGGTEVTANLTAGIYTAATLATHIATVMTAAATAAITCTYNYLTSKFTITSDGAWFAIKWSAGDNLYRTAALLLGYRIDAIDTGELYYTSDDSVLGIPGDLEQACLEIAYRMFQQSPFGRGTFDKESEQMSGEQGGTLRFNTDSMPPHVKQILYKYRRYDLL